MTTDNILHTTLLMDAHVIPADRMRGTSTGLAFKYISQAILKPGSVVIIEDIPNRKAVNKQLAFKVRSLIKHNRLIGFTEGVDYRGYWLRFDLIVHNHNT